MKGIEIVGMELIPIEFREFAKLVDKIEPIRKKYFPESYVKKPYDVEDRFYRGIIYYIRNRAMFIRAIDTKEYVVSDDKIYKVTINPDSCECPDYKYRMSKIEARCKHIYSAIIHYLFQTKVIENPPPEVLWDEREMIQAITKYWG